jgi:hypothetical protein
MPSEAAIVAPTEVSHYLSNVARSDVPAPSAPPTQALLSAAPSDATVSEQLARDALRALIAQATIAYQTLASW